MCRIFKIIYACGHGDVIKAPCEWRDDGRINILGKHVPCENSTKNLADLSRHCMACSSQPFLRTFPDPAGQDHIDIDSSCGEGNKEGYISCDEKTVMATIIQNEAPLRKKAKISRVIPIPPINSGFPTQSELYYQCCVNDEFLARRVKRKYFQQHLERRGIDYQDYLEAAQAHLEARDALNSSIFSIRGSPQAPNSIRNGQGAALRMARTPTVDSSTQTDDIENIVVRPLRPSRSSLSDSDGSSVAITMSDPQRHETSHHNIQSLLDLDIDAEERLAIESRVEEGYSSRTTEPDDGEGRGQDQFVECSDFVGSLSDEWAARGRSSPEPKQAMVPLNSLEGIAQLAEIRSFLGISPDTMPLDIWNFAIRNPDLVANITGSTLPVRHRLLGKAKRLGFDRDLGLDTVRDIADGKWELRCGFVEVWNSLNWAFEEQPEPGCDVSRSSVDETDGSNDDSKIDDLNLGLNVEDFIAHNITINEFNVVDGTEQGERYEQENKGENKSFLLEGKLAKMSFEVSFGGQLRASRHQSRNASPLRMSWTYADLEDSVLFPVSQDELVPSLSSSPASPTSEDEPVSSLFSSLLSSLTFQDDASPHMALDVGRPGTEPGNAPSLPDSLQDPEVPCITSDHNPSGFIRPRILERKRPPSLVQAGSVRGKTLLSHLRKTLAMPDTKTPQAISLFIDLHPELMKAIRTGRVPPRKPPPTTSPKQLRKQTTRAIFNPQRTLRARDDLKLRFMRQNLIYALKKLDWEEIDSEPIPFTPSSPCDGFVAGAEGSQMNNDEEEEEEEKGKSEIWVRTTASPKPSRAALMGRQYLAQHRCKKPSPLRTALTRRELEEGTTSTTTNTTAAQYNPEVWEDVDLGSEHR